MFTHIHVYDIDDEFMQHDSDEDSSFSFDLSFTDQRVSPTTRDAKIVDFGTGDQPRELRIGSTLSINEKDCLV